MYCELPAVLNRAVSDSERLTESSNWHRCAQGAIYGATSSPVSLLHFNVALPTFVRRQTGCRGETFN
jgi:hypothetical protein